ncbi:MAG: histidine kinase, partial [Clostridiaceae bacterium]|nr:histidine kinase [Clostridiaceae bacterium]
MKKKSITIRMKIISSGALLLTLAGICIGIYFWYSCFHILRDDAYESLEQSVSSLQENITNNFSLIDNTLFTFFSTSTLRKWKDNSITLDKDDFRTINSIRSDITYSLNFNTAWQSKFIDSTYLFIDDTAIALNSRYFVKGDSQRQRFQSIYDRYKDNDNSTPFILPDQEDSYVYIMKRFYNNTMMDSITLMCAVSPSFFAGKLYDLSEDISGYLIDESGNVYFSNEDLMVGGNLFANSATFQSITGKEDSYSTLLNGKKTILMHRALGDTPYTIIVSIEESSLTKDLKQSIFNLVIIFAVIIAIFIALSTFLLSVYTRFVKDMENRLNLISDKNYDARMPSYHESDLNNISNTFNLMAGEIKRLIQTVYQEQLLNNEMEIKLLQSQMNPHFLMNTLAVISTTALLHGDKELYRMVHALSEFLNTSLADISSKNSLITIEEEMTYVDCYLYLQQVRFQEKLSFSIHVDPVVSCCYIPRLTIEPLVENAVVHGIENNV